MQTTRRELFITALAALSGLAVLGTGGVALAADGAVVTFTAGTGDGPGRISVTNASNGSTTSVGLLPRTSAEACASMLADAASKVGFKTQLAGVKVTLQGRGAVVKVEGATITKSDI
jgi:hypothetical protein